MSLRQVPEKFDYHFHSLYKKIYLTWTLNLHQIPNLTLGFLLRVTESATKRICIMDSGKAYLINCIILRFLFVHFFFLIAIQFLIIYQILNTYQPLSLEWDLDLSSDFKIFFIIKYELSSQTISSLSYLITCSYP